MGIALRIDAASTQSKWSEAKSSFTLWNACGRWQERVLITTDAMYLRKRKRRRRAAYSPSGLQLPLRACNTRLLESACLRQAAQLRLSQSCRVRTSSAAYAMTERGTNVL